MNLVRKYKISKITNTKLKGKENEILKFIERWLENLTPFQYGNDYVSFIFYMDSDGNYVFGRELTTNSFYVRSIGFWDELLDDYNMSKSDSEAILKYLIKERYQNFTIQSIRSDYSKGHQIIEEEYRKYRNELTKKIQNIKNTE